MSTQQNRAGRAGPIRTAVFPVAGLGTRFLPATKSVPKEMLTVVDRPVIQHVVDEAREAGIEHLVFVTGRGKGAIEDHFDMGFELERTLAERGKLRELDGLRADLPAAGLAAFTRQGAPLGLGHAVWCARALVGDAPFAVILPDMLSRGAMRQMVDAYARHGGNVVAVETVPEAEAHQYGVVAVGEDYGQTFAITGMVEKPPAGQAPSNLIISGRYILQPEIFDVLGAQSPGAGGEIQLTDAMRRLAETQPFFGLRYHGTTYDTGTKLGFLTANVAYALQRPDLAPHLRHALAKLLNETPENAGN